MMWSEERIRELMSAARLREVNWDKQTPAERFFKNDVIFIIFIIRVFDKQTPDEMFSYKWHECQHFVLFRFRILCEEEQKSAGVKAQLESMNTPTLRWGFREWIELTLTLGWGFGVNKIHTQTLRFPGVDIKHAFLQLWFQFHWRTEYIVYTFQGGHGKIHVNDDHCGSSQCIPCGETLKIIAVLWRELEFYFWQMVSRNERKEEYRRDDLPLIYQNDLVNEWVG